MAMCVPFIYMRRLSFTTNEQVYSHTPERDRSKWNEMVRQFNVALASTSEQGRLCVWDLRNGIQVWLVAKVTEPPRSFVEDPWASWMRVM